MKLKLTFSLFPSYQILVLFTACLFKESSGEFLRRSPYNNSLCNLCGTTKTSFMRVHCTPQSYHAFGRCCLDSSNQTIGIDLGNCSIAILPDLNTIVDVNWINLAHNSKLNCTESNFSDAFKGFQKLNLIILPSMCRCPGGNNLWNHSHIQDNSITCSGQLDNCHVMKRTCSETSHCVSNGPGFYECLCSGDYMGYKCLVMKGMPLLIALCVIAGATILIVIPIWFLIKRRKNMYRTGYVIIE